MKRQLRVLVVEDSEFDAQVMISLLRRAGYDPFMQRVETGEALMDAIQGKSWDIVLADYNLPTFNALDALRQIQSSGMDVPFIIVSGGIGEDIAVAAMKAGAHDYLMKGNLNRLAPAVERELREASIRSEQRQAKRALQESEQRYRLLWETSPDAVILMDAQCHVQFVNPAVEEVFGYTPDQVVEKSFSMLQPQRFWGVLRAHLEETLRAGAVRVRWRNMEAIGQRKDGTEFPMEISMSDMELEGRRQFVCFIRDITERKQAEKELRENQEQFQVAREIQQRLFPKTSPELPGFEISGASYPADAAGGDYFDYLPMLNGQMGLVVGDVSGHGVGPALLMAETRAYLRVLTGRRENVGEILTRTNSILAEDVDPTRFVTLFMARIDPVGRSLAYTSAGHPAAFVLSAQGDLKQKLPRNGIPLGRRATTEYRESPLIPLGAGDLVLILTDGIEEAASPQGELFGVERVLDVVKRSCQLPAKEIVQALYQSVRLFAGKSPQLDDVTVILIRVLDTEPKSS